MSSVKVFEIEKEIARLLIDKLEHLEITPNRASEIARFTLSTLPEDLTDDQLEKIIPSLDDRYYELAGIVHQHLNKYENINKEETQQKASLLIKQGKLEEASTLLKEYFNNKIS